METFQFILTLPLQVEALSSAHAQVLASYLERTDPIGYENESNDESSPLGPYRVTTSGPMQLQPTWVESTPTLFARPMGALPAPSANPPPLAECADEDFPPGVFCPTPKETPEETAPPPAPELTEPRAALNKERRRRTKTWEGSDMVTAGISPDTVHAIENALTNRADLEAAKELVVLALSRFYQPMLQVLREDEGQELLAAVQALPPVPADDPEPPADQPIAPLPSAYPVADYPIGTKILSQYGDGVVEAHGPDATGKGVCLHVKMQTGEKAGALMRFYPNELERAPETAPLDEQGAAPATAPRPPWLR